MENISTRLRKAMSIRNMSQVDLVEKTKISKGALSSYISGRYVPKQNNVALLAKALDVSEEWLTGADVPMENSLMNIIQQRLIETKMTLEELSEKAKVSLHWLQHIDKFVPGEFGDEEIGYVWITRVAEVLDLPGGILRTALAKQEIPIPDDLLRVTAEEAFGGINTYTSSGKVDSTEKMRETTLTPRDQRDIAKDVDRIMEKLSLGEDGPASYNGETLSPESMELFKEELQIALKRLKLINKERYNPRKNKK